MSSVQSIWKGVAAVCGILLLLGIFADNVQAKGLFDDMIINRPTARIGVWPFTNPTPYRVYLISNIPEAQVMPVVGAAALDRRGQVTYLPLSAVGTYGKRQVELLPYDTFSSRRMLVAVVDRSTMTAGEQLALGKLLAAHFGRMRAMTDATSIGLWIENVGKSGKEYNVLIDLPVRRVLEPAVQALRALPVETVPDKSKQLYNVVYQATRTAIITDDRMIGEEFRMRLPFSDTLLYTPDEFENYVRTDDIDTRIIALNWNGDVEWTPNTIARLLPEPLLKEIDASPVAERAQLTRWQRFTQRALARSYVQQGITTWVITAPTGQLVQQLATQVISENLAQRSYEIPVANLSGYESMALGVYLFARDPDPSRLIRQHQLEQQMEGLLQGKITVRTGQNWGSMLQRELRNESHARNPFMNDDGARVLHQASNAELVLLLWAQEINPSVTFTHEKVRVTRPYPPFRDIEPSEPSRPDPNERLLFGGRKYPQGKNDPKYQADLDYYYRIERPRYEREYREWERAKRRWQQDRDNYRVNYDYNIFVNPQVEFNGFLNLLDTVATRQYIWSSDILTVQHGDARMVQTIPVVAYGEDSEPAAPRELAYFTNHFGWSDYVYDRQVLLSSDSLYALGSHTLSQGLLQGLDSLLSVALWPGDLKAWNQPGARPDTPLLP